MAIGYLDLIPHRMVPFHMTIGPLSWFSHNVSRIGGTIFGIEIEILIEIS